MTPRKRKSRIYWRTRGGTRRAWFDGRDYSDVGGKLEPLIPIGERFATTDPDVATKLAKERLDELETARRRRALFGHAHVATLTAQAADYLIARKRAGKVTDAWLSASEGFLKRASEFFGAERSLESIRVSDIRAWAEHLLTAKGKTARPSVRRVSGGTCSPSPLSTALRRSRNSSHLDSIRSAHFGRSPPAARRRRSGWRCLTRRYCWNQRGPCRECSRRPVRRSALSSRIRCSRPSC